MPRFFFPVDCDSSRYADKEGEVFATSHKAETYAP